MRLKTLKVFGFKTFAESTLLDFNTGITAVVGPNGSGKSNLVDAIRWVLGEQNTRQLRSQHLEDVIFAGNSKRRPLGMAEVTITFDNSDRKLPIDFSEVEVTRRAYRAGEIEYFINRNHVRLRDVMDLLMGTGLGPGSYSIVSQGQIDAILTSKPTERRALFEETAGINRFLARKNEAMRRLEQTEANAIRISDLIAELERRIPELDTQVRRAKRYRRVSARVRDLELLSYMRASASRREEREQVRRRRVCATKTLQAVAAARAATLGAEAERCARQLYTLELEREERRVEAQARACQARRAASRLRRSTGAARRARRAEQRLDRRPRPRRKRTRTLAKLRIAELSAATRPARGARRRSAHAVESRIVASLTQARGALDTASTPRCAAFEAIAAERVQRGEAERRARLASLGATSRA